MSGPAGEGPIELADRLELLERLGRGGFAVVHRARERESGREVALKLLHLDRAGQAVAQARLYREGQVAARLDHPGIVRVHAAGTFRGQPCLVYELVDGARPFADVLPELPLARRLEVIRDVARALGWAHARGVLHRDVKPENVLIDARGQARLTDFGLAAATDLERLTRTGAVVGTPAYMAPEQLLGAREALGPPADVWGLGVMLYQALTDELPFAASGLLALVGEVTGGRLTPPGALRAGVAPGLERVCLQALERDPTRRYPHADALADDLERVLRGERPLAPPPGAGPGGALAAALAAGSGLGVLLLVLVIWLPAPTPLPAPLARAPSAGSSPAPPAPTRPTDPQLQLDALLAAPDPWSRGEAAATWLEAHPGHPRAREARAALAVARGEAPLRVFEWGTRAREQRPVFVGSGATFACAGAETLLRRGDALSGEVLPSWARLRALALRPHPQGGLLQADLRGVQWLVAAGDAASPALRFACSGRPVALAVAPRRGLLAVCVEEEVEVFRLADAQPLASLPLGEAATCVGFSPDERLLVGGGVSNVGLIPNGWLQAWDAARDFAPVWRREELDGFYCLTFSPRGALFAGTRSCLLPELDPATGSPVRYLKGEGVERGAPLMARLATMAHVRPVQGLIVSPDGARLYSIASADDAAGSELGVWSLPDGRPLGPARLHPGHRFVSVDLDATGRLLLIGCRDGAVVSWVAPR